MYCVEEGALVLVLGWPMYSMVEILQATRPRPSTAAVLPLNGTDMPISSEPGLPKSRIKIITIMSRFEKQQILYERLDHATRAVTRGTIP